MKSGASGGKGEDVEWAGSHYYSYSYYLFMGRLSPKIVAAHNIGTNYISGLRSVCWPAYTCEDRPTCSLESPDLELTDLISTRLLWGLNNTVNLISATRCSGCAIQSPAMTMSTLLSPMPWMTSLDEWKTTLHWCVCFCLGFLLIFGCLRIDGRLQK